MLILLLSCLQVLYDKVCEYLELEERVEVRSPMPLGSAMPYNAASALHCFISVAHGCWEPFNGALLQYADWFALVRVLSAARQLTV